MRLTSRSVALILFALASSLGACADEGEKPRSEVKPEQIDGTYEARIPQSEFSDFPDSPGNGGAWTILFSDGSYTLTGPRFRITERVERVADELRITADPAPTGAFNCYKDDERVTGPGLASGTYAIGDNGDLTFTAVDEPCPFRALLLERTWTQADEATP